MSSPTKSKFTFVCCEFLSGHCSAGASNCPYVHSDLTAKPCQHGEKCSLGHYHRNWKPDEDFEKCSCCSAKFGLLLWRHHCRYDGNVVCADCLDRNFDPFPVCKKCKDSN